MKKMFCLILPVVLITSGCCFNSDSPKTEYFTVSGQSEHSQYNYHIDIAPFTIDQLYGSKMVFLREPNSVFFDSYNRWAQTPDKLVTSYFNTFFNNPASQSLEKSIIPIRLNAEIFKFECNLTNKECLLCMKVTATNTSDNTKLFTQVFTEKLQMNKLTASSFANSMARAVTAVAGKIDTKINYIYEHNPKKKVRGNGTSTTPESSR